VTTLSEMPLEGAPLDDGGYPGFLVFSSAAAEFFSESRTVTVACGSAAVDFTVTRRELVEAVEAPQATMARRTVDACERLWSRWLAL
jgi:hypothetical protein